MNQGAPPLMMDKKRGRERSALLKRSLALVPRRDRNLLILCCIFGTAFSLITPLLIGMALEQVLRQFNAPPGPMNPFMRTLSLMLAAFLLSALLGFAQGRIGARVAQKLARQLRSDMFGDMLHVPLYYLDTHQHGDLMSRVMNDVENLSALLPQVLCSFLSAGLSIGTCLALIYMASPALVLVNIVAVIVSLITTTTLSRKVFEAAIGQQRSLGRMNSHVTDDIADHLALRMLKKKQDLFDSAARDSDDLANTSFRLQFLRGLLEPLMMVFGNLGFLSVIVIGCAQIAAGAIQIGALQSCILYSRQFVKSINDLSDLFSRLQVSLSSASRIFEILDQKSETEEEAERPAVKADFASDVVLDDVCFAYTKRKAVLDHLSMTLKAGQVTALVGSTGAGKTTITNLLLRFYKPDSGTIRIGETDLQQIGLKELRANIGIALQDSAIIEGTVYDNIMYGCAQPSMDKCIEAAKRAHLHEKIDQLPWKYHTPLTNEGCKWSVGEKQLLSIARIMAMDPRIVVIDEALSSIDPKTELEVNEALKEMMKGRTCIVIAHRLSTIREADTIVVLSGGKVAEMGSHEQLKSSHGQYDRLYTLLKE